MPALRCRWPSGRRRTSGRPGPAASWKDLVQKAAVVAFELATLGLVLLDHLQQALRPPRVPEAENQAQGEPVVSGLEQICMNILRGFAQHLAHRSNQRAAIAGPLVVERSFHGNRVNWLRPPRGGGRVVECERLLSA